MSIEGQIHIRLDPGSEQSVHISSSRPRQVMQLLQGLTPTELQVKIPLLYALCGKAQALAATQALHAASVTQDVSAEQIRAVVLEAMQEYLWRFLIDLPQQLHKTPELTVFASLRKTLLQLVHEAPDSDERPYLLRKLDRGLKTELLGMPAQQWLQLDIPGWDDWLNRYPVVLPTWLRKLDAQLQQWPAINTTDSLLVDPPQAELLAFCGQELANQAEFAFAPSWGDQQPETGALSYQNNHPWLQALRQRGCSAVLVRMLARLFELLRLRQCLELDPQQAAEQLCGSVSLGPESGLGWVRTARGLLIHRVSLEQGVTQTYQILAPTEWNFHPQGPLAKGLENWLEVGPQQLSDWVSLQVLSLDPCVSYQFQVGRNEEPVHA